MNDVAETVKKNEMPLNSYLWIHKDAILNEAQKQMIIDWAHSANKKIMNDSLKAVRP